MTGKTISLDGARMGGAVLRALPPAESAAATSQSDSPEARFGARAVARAELARVYAGLLGVDAVLTDILETMSTSQAQGDGVQPQRLADGLATTGLLTSVEHASTLTDDMWPALAQMTSGQFVLVLAQSRGDLVIYDTTCTDNRAHVPLTEFEPFFTA